MALFRTPDADLEDSEVVADILRRRADLRSWLRAPRRWTGGLRRTAQARAILGSNTIEGYTVSEQDAIAAVDDEEPLTADERTWAEILGYRRVLTYVLNVATGPGFQIDLALVNAMHFMLLEHELAKHPGRYRSTAIHVRDDRNERNVYEGPDPDDVPRLMRELVDELREPLRVDSVVRAAMAHLNLVMIHPYRDGNGRMARALQTMVLAQDDLLEPAFASIEEWLGRNTEDYHAVLAATGQGRWRPEGDASLWVKFHLRAHHLQAQTVGRRFTEADQLYVRLDEVVARHRLPARAEDALFDAALGGRVTRSSYVKRANGLDERTATRDLGRLTELGLLASRGQTRSRHYVAGDELSSIVRAVRQDRRAPTDPYPDLMTTIRRAVPQR